MINNIQIINNNDFSSLRKFWSKLFNFRWQLGLALILLFGIPRFFIVMLSYVTGSYVPVMFIFIIMWFLPLILLNKNGRRSIGFKKPKGIIQLVLSFLAGAICCILIFYIFTWLYGNSISNAFVYIGGSNAGAHIPNSDKWIYYILAVIPSMIFSPIGEEFLYRGIIHGCFATSMKDQSASYCDSAAFALTHIAHFGIIWHMGGWAFIIIPTLLWILSMFFACQVFYHCKIMSDSIWGAVASHAGFNATMMTAIFFLL